MLKTCPAKYFSTDKIVQSDMRLIVHWLSVIQRAVYADRCLKRIVLDAGITRTLLLSLWFTFYLLHQSVLHQNILSGPSFL